MAGLTHIWYHTWGRPTSRAQATCLLPLQESASHRVMSGQLGGQAMLLQPIRSPYLLCLQRSATFEQMSGCGLRPALLLKGGSALSNLPSGPAGVCCLKHDIFGEFDELTDVARFHRHPRRKGPIVPSFIFFIEGALVSLLCMRSRVAVSCLLYTCCLLQGRNILL